jgi:hypothetical protein
MICKVCNCSFDALDTSRLVCFNCSKIDYEKMYRMAQFEVARLKNALAVMIDLVQSNNPKLNLDGYIKLIGKDGGEG